jgi:hypothetical protein
MITNTAKKSYKSNVYIDFVHIILDAAGFKFVEMDEERILFDVSDTFSPIPDHRQFRKHGRHLDGNDFRLFVELIIGIVDERSAHKERSRVKNIYVEAFDTLLHNRSFPKELEGRIEGVKK